MNPPQTLKFSGFRWVSLESNPKNDTTNEVPHWLQALPGPDGWTQVRPKLLDLPCQDSRCLVDVYFMEPSLSQPKAGVGNLNLKALEVQNQWSIQTPLEAPF